MIDNAAPLLTIAIPTWNRASYLEQNLSRLRDELIGVPYGRVEILVSDNCSTDSTADVVKRSQALGLALKYVCNRENIGWGANFVQCFNLAKGKYVLLLGDDDLLTDGALSFLLGRLGEKDYGVVCLGSYGFDYDFEDEFPGYIDREETFSDGGRFLTAIGHMMTFISACVINKTLLLAATTKEHPSSNLPHVNWVVSAALLAKECLYCQQYLIASKRNNSSSYDFSQVFVGELWEILDSYADFGLRQDTIRALEKRMLFSYYPYYTLKMRWSGVHDLASVLRNFNTRFAHQPLFRFWVAPIIRLPAPLAIVWGSAVTAIGRAASGSFRRGISFVWYRAMRMGGLKRSAAKEQPTAAIVHKSPKDPGYSRAYQVCTNCVMDTSDSGITFDAQGRCDYCSNFYANILPHWHTDERGERKIRKIVERIKHDRRNEEHDCLIGLSGGIDSSYVTYLAKEKFGLRPLLYHVDAGWNSQQAVNNIEKLVDGLGLDLYTEVVDWPEMRDLQLAFFRAQVPHLDTPQDHAFFAGLYNFAAKNRVKYIITGANYSTECVREPLEWHYHASDVRQLRDIHLRFGTRPLEKFPLAGILKYRLYYRFAKGVRVVKPLDYVPYVKEKAIDDLVERFGWQRYAHKHYESRFTRFYEGFWLPTKFGYDKRRAHFSSLILTNQLTRDEALSRLAQPAYDAEIIAQDFEYVATKLGVSVQELTALLNGPRKTYRDYDNDMALMDLGAKALRLLGVQRAIIR